MKKLLTTALTGAIVFGAAASAQADEAVQKEEFTISPTVLSRTEPQNIEFVNTITTSPSGAGVNPEQPPSASRTAIDLPAQFRINNTTFPYCDGTATEIQNTTTAQAKEICGVDSRVSEDAGSESEIIVDLPGEGTTLLVPVDVTVFNEDGDKLLFHMRADSVNNTSVLTGKIQASTAGSAFGKAVDIPIPPLLAGAISLFKLAVPENGYIQAKCDPSTMTARATTDFTSPSTSTEMDDHSVECTTLPDTSIDSGPTGLTNNNDPSFTFSSDEAGATFECRLDGPGGATGSSASCTSPRSYTDLADGDYTFQVRATGSNTDPSPATRSFTVDTQAPDTAINFGPTGLSNNNDPSFTFSSEAGATFECRLDGPGGATGNFAGCTSSKSYTNLPDGSYTFQVRATDPASNTDPTPAVRNFTVDATPPDTAIDSGPSGTTADNTPTFGFSSAEIGSSFECKVDSGPFGPCSGPGNSHTTFGLADGPHEFQVRAIDPASNIDPTPAIRSFTVASDTTPPQTTIDSGPTGTTNDNDQGFAFSSEPGSTFDCRLDGPGAAAGTFTACVSPRAFIDLPDGGYTFQVRATDSGGLPDPTPATRSFTIDTIDPETEITKKPKAKVNTRGRSAEIKVSFTSEPGAKFKCQVDEGSYRPCTSPYVAKAKSKPGKGKKHTIAVQATDQAGNVGDAATVSFKVIRRR